jgi:DNA-binding GntR family transcriptional regulator
MRTAIEAHETQRFVELDRVFHRRIHAASGYERAVQETERLRDATDRYVVFYVSMQSRASDSLKEHEAILAACRMGDSNAAARLIAEHIWRGADVLLTPIREAEAGSSVTIADRPT